LEQEEEEEADEDFDEEDEEFTQRPRKRAATTAGGAGASTKAGEKRKRGTSNGTVDKQKLDKRERNKISASKYRKRRKMYVEGLEQKVQEQQQTIDALNLELETLRTQVKVLKSQNELYQSLLLKHSINIAALQNTAAQQQLPDAAVTKS